MELSWQGKYRAIFDTMYRAANAYSQVCHKDTSGGPSAFSAYDVQIIEHTLEHEHWNMKQHAESLGLSSSSYTKCVQSLERRGFLEKYHRADNNKDIYLKVSPSGLEQYRQYAKDVRESFFKPLFDKLDTCSDEELQAIQDFLALWAEFCYGFVRDNKTVSQNYVRIESGKRAKKTSFP